MKNKKKIKINGKIFEYSLSRKRGFRNMRLAVYSGGAFVVTAPKWYPVYIINRFLTEKADWIYEKLQHVDFRELSVKKKKEKQDYALNKKSAKAVIESRVEFFNRYYNFPHNRLTVKNQKTCWGSCSAKKNLNFSYKVAGLPEELRDYVIVHELCHLRELNHSNDFWKLVRIAVPDYKALRNKLRHHRL